MQEIMAGLKTKKQDKSFAIETKDTEIQEFVSRLEQKKRRRWMLIGIGVVVLLIAILVRLLR